MTARFHSGLCALGALLSLSGAAETAYSDTRSAPPATENSATDDIARIKTDFSTLIIWDDGEYRCLSFGKRENLQSCVNRNDKNDFRYEYIRMMYAAILLDEKPRPTPTRVLVLGLGGAALPKLIAGQFPGVHIDAVEIDPGVYEAAKEHLYYQPSANTKVHVEDAFAFVERAAKSESPAQYDVIWLDCYDDEHVPEHLMTDEFVTGLRTILKPSGVLAANLWRSHPSYKQSVARYQRTFTELWRIKGRNTTNHVLIGLRRDLGIDKKRVMNRAYAMQKRMKPPFNLAKALKRLKKVD